MGSLLWRDNSFDKNLVHQFIGSLLKLDHPRNGEFFNRETKAY